MSRRDDLVPHMRRVQHAERDMRDLAMVWQMIESAASISCPEEVAPLLPTLVRTRERFEHLQSRLVGRLVEESTDQIGDELEAKAQCAIDILVRNLFERTADVGFLAIDDTVRTFCAATDRPEAMCQAMTLRLTEYQAKYSVYDDVILLAPDGAVLNRLLPGIAAEGVCRDDWVSKVPSRDGYHEIYGPSSLGDDATTPVLLYAHRITQVSGQVVGILVLRFRLADELNRIFTSMADERGQLALVLIDDRHRVVASNDPAHIPLDAQLRPVKEGEVQITTFSGREYLAVACPSRGYQGYAGPGWRAQAMVSLLTAFAGQGSNDVAAGQDVLLDNPELNAIQGDADGINRELRRVVWNGQLMARRQLGDSLRLKAVLAEVNMPGNAHANGWPRP